MEGGEKEERPIYPPPTPHVIYQILLNYLFYLLCFFSKKHKIFNYNCYLSTAKSPPPQGQGRFIKIADPSVCPTGGGGDFFFVPLKIPCFLPCNTKELLGDMTCILLRLLWLRSFSF